MEDHPLTADAPGGAPGVMRHHFELLARCDIELALVVVSDPVHPFGLATFIREEQKEWERIRERCVGVRHVTLKHSNRPLRTARRVGAALVQPGSYLTSHLDPSCVSELASVIADLDPDVIWAENFLPTALAVRAGRGRPVVYGHHDWVWRVWRFSVEQKGRAWRPRVVCQLMRRAEESMVRRVRAVVSVSRTEVLGLQEYNAHAAYFPPAYPPVDLAACAPGAGEARVVHVGGMPTIANRIGLERFLDLAWPVACTMGERPPSLWIVGSLKHASDSLLGKLDRFHAIRTGFVERLTSVLRPYDIHIVPWEHDTGARSKIPLALNYAQVVLATRTTAQSLPELVDGQNCVLVESLQEMGTAIVQLLPDEVRRRELGKAARQTFLEHYTQAAVQPRFNQFIGELCSG